MPGGRRENASFYIVGNVILHVMACGEASVIRLTEVYYAALITRYIVSYGKREF